MRASLNSLLICGALLVLTTGCMTESYLRRGDAAFAAGRPEEALAYYERVHRGSSKYREDPAFQRRMQTVRVEVLLIRGRRQLAGKQWDMAIQTADEALALERTNGAAQQLRTQARQGAAQDALSRACQAADRGKLAEAGQEAARGLVYEPTNQALLQAQSSLSPAAPGQDVMGSAAGLMAEKRWEQADSILGKLLETYPYHLAARSRRAEVQGHLRTADSLMRSATSRLERGDLLASEKHLQELLADSPHRADAANMLVDVRQRLAEARRIIAQARESEKAGRVGMSLHRLRQAQGIWAAGVPASEITRLQDSLRDLYPVQISWDAKGDDADLVRGTLLERLGNGRQDKAGATYELDVQVSTGQARIELVSMQRLQHQYVTRENQPNPNLPLLRDEADRWDREERRWQHRCEEAREELRRAEHRIPPDAPNREQTLRHLRHQLDRAQADYNNARERAWRARRDLRMAPAIVTVDRSVSWPYVQRQMRKTIVVSAVASMRFNGQSVTDATNFSQTATSEDTVIDHANPALGLAADDLSLASDAALKAGAGPALAEELASWAWSVAREAWASQLASGAEDLERQGKNDDAMELRMAAEAHRAPQGK